MMASERSEFAAILQDVLRLSRPETKSDAERRFWWGFPAADSNAAARALFRHLDAVMSILSTPGQVFLTTIELDVSLDRFPDALSQYFRDVDSSGERQFFVGSIRNTHGPESAVGRLTFQAEPGDAIKVLDFNGGIRWGACLSVWGIQADERSVEDVLELSPTEPAHVDQLFRASRAAWLTAPDLNALRLWTASTIDPETLIHLRSLSVP